MIGMISQDGESVDFVKPVKITSQKGVEGWLKDVENAMVEAIKRRIKDADSDLKKDNTERTEWVLRHCGQAIAVVSLLDWTEQVETAIQDMEEDPFALGNLLNTTNENLK